MATLIAQPIVMPTPNIERIVKLHIENDHAPADAAVLLCIDPRFWAKDPEGKSIIQSLIEAKGWKKWVPLTEAGGIKLLVSEDSADQGRQKALLERIEEELKLHHPKVLLLTVHRDCGKYGYSKAFNNDAQVENDRLYGDLWKAEQLLKTKFAGQVEIQSCVIDLDGAESVAF